ncbi:unnamed protein product [Orchesella dallaii]|uniref:Uncharacterized protein n=1 Tax=Orchesella dallaii TaxID=48710 RepID=A0ABP1RFI7_9HEXA
MSIESELENAFLLSDDASFLHKISISDQVFLAFNMECGDNATAHHNVFSVWEVYSLQFQPTDQKCIWATCTFIQLNEVFHTNCSNEHESAYHEILPELQRRRNFHQTKLKAVAPLVKEIKLEVNWDVDESTGNITIFGGMAVDIFRDFQDLLNFSGEIVPGDWLLTGSQPNVNISALNLKPVTGDLMKKRKVEIMIGHLTPIPSRLQSSDILMPSSYNRLWAYIHQPSASSVRDIFTIAFQPPLWIAFVFSWILILISVRVCIKLFQENVGHNPNQSFIAPPSSRLELDTDIDDDVDGDDAFVSDPLFCSSSNFFSCSGWELHPKRLSLRLLFFLGTLFTLICFLAYSAQIVSILATLEIPIPSLAALFRSSLPIFATLESSNIAEVVKGLQSQGKINPRINPFLPLTIGVKKTFETPMAYISYDHMFNVVRRRFNISEGEYCSKIYSFPVLKTKSMLVTAMTMPKYSPLREMFNHKIIFLKERGLLHRHQQNFHLAGGVQCIGGQGRNANNPLALDDLFTAISLIVSGYILSLGVLFMEKLILELKRRITKRKAVQEAVFKRNIQF